MRCNLLFCDCGHCGSRTTSSDSGKNLVLSSYQAIWPEDSFALEYWPITALRWKGEIYMATWTMLSLRLSSGVGFDTYTSSCFLPICQAFNRISHLGSSCRFWFFFRGNLDRLATSSSHFTWAHAQDNMSSIVLHWYLLSSLYRSPSRNRPLLKVEIAVEAFHLGMATFYWLKHAIKLRRGSARWWRIS